MLLWLLGARADEIAFVGWLDTRGVPWPGQPDRTCDTVASVEDRAASDFPWAVLLEVQVVPDPEMFGRVLQYLGGLWVDVRPSPHRGDRFAVGAVVINLTGKGRTGRALRLGQTAVLTTLGVVEWDLEELDAGKVMTEVEAGRAPRLLLAWLPLMQKGGDPAIIRRWLGLARQEADKKKREALVLAGVFAEKAGCAVAWREALKGWEVMESQIVKEWTAQARAEGETKGKLEGKREGELGGLAKALLQMLERRFKKVPADLRSVIEGVKDGDRLTAWIDLAFEARSLRKFRERAGL
jgi:hypothetical protein